MIVHYPDKEHFQGFQERVNTAYVGALESVLNSRADMQVKKDLLGQTINYLNLKDINEESGSV